MDESELIEPKSDVARVNLLRKFLEPITGPWTRANLFSWFRLIVLILFIKGCVVDQYSIPSSSMEPTLHGDPGFFRGDRVLTNKWCFGARIPFTTIYLWKWDVPKRWDIVVFRNPNKDSDHKILIKRVVGLPGELVTFKDGKLLINGEVVPFPEGMPKDMHYLSKVDAYMNSQEAKTNEEFNEWTYLFNEMKYGMGLVGEDIEKFNRIPEGHYMMCGDNTKNSYDSRMYGWVPAENLYGRSFAIWWPWPRRRDFSGFSSTWWGMALIYGIPALLVLSEVVGQWRHKKSQTGIDH